MLQCKKQAFEFAPLWTYTPQNVSRVMIRMYFSICLCLLDQEGSLIYGFTSTYIIVSQFRERKSGKTKDQLWWLAKYPYYEGCRRVVANI